MITRCSDVRRGHSLICGQALKTLVSQVPSNSNGSSSRPLMRAATSEVRGRQWPEISPSTRWPLGAYPSRRTVEDATSHSSIGTSCLP